MSDNANSASATGKEGESLVGKVLANRYTISKPVGEGGMGVVYLADQIGLDRKVVVKVLSADASVPDAEARFNREAKTLSRLQHPNIVGIHDFGIDGTLHYLVMEYIEGRTLAWFLRKTGPLSLVVFARIANQMLEAVGEAHRVGLIHRDLKPANVMLCRRGDNPLHVKVLDFGLSKLADADTQLTRPQHIIGSAGFMAPEQIKGLAVDQRSDVYALGVIMFRMLTGNAPYEGADQMAVLYQHVHAGVPSVSEALPEGHDIPDALMDVVERCMAKNPSERYNNGQEACEALRAAMPSSAVFRAPLGQLPSLERSTSNTNSWQDGVDSFDSSRTSQDAPRRASTSKTLSKSGSHSVPTTTGNVPATSTALIGAFGITALLLIAAIGVVGLGLIVFTSQPAVPVATTPTDVVDEVSEEQIRGAALRTEGLAALEAANYELAVQKLTEALKYDPDRTGDTTDLLKIAMEMRTTAASAPPAVASSPAPTAVAVVDAAPKKVEPPKKKPAASDAKVQEPEPAPAPEPVIAKGTLLVTSTPSGMAFEVAGVGGSVTPARMEVPAGSVSVTFFNDGKATETRVETVNASSVRVVDYKAPAAEPKPVVAATAPPPAVTPAVVTPPVVVAPPVPVATAVPKPAAATTSSTPPAAAPKIGELLIESPNLYGEVWVNGVKVGFPPIVAKKIPVGTATIEVRVGGAVRRTKTVEVAADQRVTVRL